jgi:hypothetical protein
MLNEVKHLYDASAKECGRSSPLWATFGSIPVGRRSAERPAGAISIAGATWLLHTPYPL